MIDGPYEAQLIQLRRDLHSHPEVGLFLPKTRERLRSELRDLPLTTRDARGSSSFSATLQGKAPGPTVVLRADMDALPIREESGLEYASRNGAMHACGHDIHTAALVGAARILSRELDELPGAVIFAFEAGEEAHGGARIMLEDGLLAHSNPPAAAFALHVVPGQLGAFSTKPSSITAASSILTIRLVGSGGHAALPHLTHDPVPVAAEIILAVQTYMARRVSAFDSAVLSFTMVHAGAVINAVPDLVELGASVRTFTSTVHHQLQLDLPQLITKIAQAHSCVAEVDFTLVYPAVENDTRITNLAERAIERRFGDAMLSRLTNPLTISEDFAFIASAIPANFMLLGATDTSHANDSLHSPQIVFDESVIEIASEALANVALEILRS